MEFRDASDKEHMEHFVEIEGVINPDGSPGRISMDAETFLKLGFSIGQKISLQQARELALQAVGGTSDRLWRLCNMAQQLGPGRKIVIDEAD